jgi:hypothetical protein
MPPKGTIPPIQFAVVLKDPLVGVADQVASTACAAIVGSASDTKADVASSSTRLDARRRAAQLVAV